MENINKKITGMGFHHIALKAADFEKSLDFYTNGLGMTPVLSWGEGNGRITMLDMGNGDIVELFAGGGDEFAKVGKYIHFAMGVDDVDAAYDAAIAAGAVSKTAPKDAPLNSQPYKVTLRVAFVYGPDGEELEFFKMTKN